VELGAIVSGDGFESLRMAAHETDGALIRVFLGTSSELADHDVAGLALDDGDEAVVIPLANDGIDLPVADLGAKVGGERPLADVTFASETTTAVVGAIAFATSLASAPKISVQRAAEDPIAPDVAVDCFVTDGERAAQSAADLFGTPPLAKLGIDELQIAARETLITSRTRASAGGALDGFARTVVAIPAGAIALELSADGAAVAAELTSDLGLVETLPSQGRENIPLLGGDLVIRHRRLPCLGG